MELLSLDPETGITYKMIQGVPFVNCTPIRSTFTLRRMPNCRLRSRLVAL